MKLATIVGEHGQRITICTGLDAEGERVLLASNGDSVHPGRRAGNPSYGYPRGRRGTIQALEDIALMWDEATWQRTWTHGVSHLVD